MGTFSTSIVADGINGGIIVCFDDYIYDSVACCYVIHNGSVNDDGTAVAFEVDGMVTFKANMLSI